MEHSKAIHVSAPLNAPLKARKGFLRGLNVLEKSSKLMKESSTPVEVITHLLEGTSRILKGTSRPVNGPQVSQRATGHACTPTSVILSQPSRSTVVSPGQPLAKAFRRASEWGQQGQRAIRPFSRFFVHRVSCQNRNEIGGTRKTQGSLRNEGRAAQHREAEGILEWL